LQHLPGPRQALGVVHVGVRGDDQLARREAEVHLADQLEDLGQLVEEADVDQGVLGPAVDQVDVDPQAPPGLDVHLDDAGEDVAAFDHRRTTSSSPGPCPGQTEAIVQRSWRRDNSLFRGQWAAESAQGKSIGKSLAGRSASDSMTDGARATRLPAACYS